MLIAKEKSGGTVKPIPAGSYAARCVGVIDLGEQLNSVFKKWSRKTLLVFELPGERVDVDGVSKPRWLSKSFTLSLSKKSTLYAFLSGWGCLGDTAQGLDLTTLLDRPAMISVGVDEGRDGKQYNEILAAMPMPAGMDVPDAESTLMVFDLDHWNDDVFHQLPEWMRKKVEQSQQYITGPHLVHENLTFPELAADETGGDVPCPF